MLSFTVGYLTHTQPGEQVLIIDAGGGTIDISTYTVLNSRPLQVEELYEPKCEPGQSSWQIFVVDSIRLGLVEGGELVTMRATEKIKGAFQHPTCRPSHQPATRDVEGLWTRHSGELGSVFPEVRRWDKEGLFEQPTGSIRQIWLPEG